MPIRKFTFRYELSNGATGTGTIRVAGGIGVESAIRARYHLDDAAEIFAIQEVRREGSHSIRR